MDGQANLDVLFVIVKHLVVFDGAAFGAAAMLSGSGTGYVPLYKGCARDKRNIVEIDNLRRTMSKGVSPL